MSRLHTSVEGCLTIPLPRPFDGLPPPFGLRRNAMRKPEQLAVRQAKASTSMEACPPYVLPDKPLLQRADTHVFAALMAEAKHYRAMNTVRPRSSHSDHLLAGIIFTSCTIALTWLLVTYSVKDAEKSKSVTATPTASIAVNSRVDRREIAAKAIVADTLRISKAAQTAALGPQQVAQVVPMSTAEPRQVAQVASASSTAPQPGAEIASRSFVVTKPTAWATAGGNATFTPPQQAENRVKVARLSEDHSTEHVTSSRTNHPAALPAPSTQPEQTARLSRSHNEALPDMTQRMNRAAKQQPPSSVTPFPALVAGDDNWNDHMTQRRITDDPSAFQGDRGGQ